MLNFRNTTFALLCFAVLVILLVLLGIRPGMFPVIVPIAWLALLITGSARICMNFYVKAFCRGNTREKLITLTFDDGPDPEVTPQVMKLLGKYRIHAAFFVTGQNAEKHPGILSTMSAEGHVIGIHSYRHSFFFDLYPGKKMERDLRRTADLIENALASDGSNEGAVKSGAERGGKGLLFRPPYGVTNPTVARVSAKLGCRVVGWSVRSLDTTIKEPAKVAERIKRKLHPGAVVLMHDTRKDLPVILEEVIPSAMARGYRFAGIEEMMELY